MRSFDEIASSSARAVTGSTSGPAGVAVAAGGAGASPPVTTGTGGELERQYQNAAPAATMTAIPRPIHGARLGARRELLGLSTNASGRVLVIAGLQINAFRRGGLGRVPPQQAA
jgi:hypothetical protein